MLRYEVKAFDEHGSYVHGASFWASDTTSAVEKFAALPLTTARAELYRGKQILRIRTAPEASPQAAAGWR